MGATKGRGRPPLDQPPIRVDVTLMLHPGEDDDLLRWFKALPPGQKARRVKVALRQGGANLNPAATPTADELVDDDLFAELLGAL